MTESVTEREFGQRRIWLNLSECGAARRMTLALGFLGVSVGVGIGGSGLTDLEEMDSNRDGSGYSYKYGSDEVGVSVTAMASDSAVSGTEWSSRFGLNLSARNAENRIEDDSPRSPLPLALSPMSRFPRLAPAGQLALTVEQRRAIQREKKRKMLERVYIRPSSSSNNNNTNNYNNNNHAGPAASGPRNPAAVSVRPNSRLVSSGGGGGSGGSSGSRAATSGVNSNNSRIGTSTRMISAGPAAGNEFDAGNEQSLTLSLSSALVEMENERGTRERGESEHPLPLNMNVGASHPQLPGLRRDSAVDADLGRRSTFLTSSTNLLDFTEIKEPQRTEQNQDQNQNQNQNHNQTENPNNPTGTANSASAAYHSFITTRVQQMLVINRIFIPLNGELLVNTPERRRQLIEEEKLRAQEEGRIREQVGLRRKSLLIQPNEAAPAATAMPIATITAAAETGTRLAPLLKLRNGYNGPGGRFPPLPVRRNGNGNERGSQAEHAGHDRHAHMNPQAEEKMQMEIDSHLIDPALDAVDAAAATAAANKSFHRLRTRLRPRPHSSDQTATAAATNSRAAPKQQLAATALALSAIPNNILSSIPILNPIPIPPASHSLLSSAWSDTSATASSSSSSAAAAVELSSCSPSSSSFASSSQLSVLSASWSSSASASSASASASLSLASHDEQNLYELICFLALIPLFSSLPLSSMFCLSRHLHLLKLDECEMIAREGDTEDHLFLIKHGRVDVKLILDKQAKLKQKHRSRARNYSNLHRKQQPRHRSHSQLATATASGSVIGTATPTSQVGNDDDDDDDDDGIGMSGGMYGRGWASENPESDLELSAAPPPPLPRRYYSVNSASLDVACLSRGDFCGESVLVTGRHTASIVAMDGAVECYAIHRRPLLAHLDPLTLSSLLAYTHYTALLTDKHAMVRERYGSCYHTCPISFRFFTATNSQTQRNLLTLAHSHARQALRMEIIRESQQQRKQTGEHDEPSPGSVMMAAGSNAVGIGSGSGIRALDERATAQIAHTLRFRGASSSNSSSTSTLL